MDSISQAKLAELAQTPRWRQIAEKFTRGAAIRKKAEEDAAKAKLEAAEAARPKPVDPSEAAVHMWAVRDENTFTALLNLITTLSQRHAAERREAVASHAHMAYHEGECAALSELRTLLLTLKSGQV